MPPHEMLEVAMLLCFSTGWYWSIATMLRTRVVVGKSTGFVVVICVGYGFGLGSHLLAHAQTGALSPLFYVYLWNLSVILLDLALTLRFRRVGAAAAR